MMGLLGKDTRRLAALLLLLAALAATVAACGGGGDDDAGAVATTAPAAEGTESLGLDPSNLLAVIDANEAAIEKAEVFLHSYTAPGDGHGILEWPTFYEMEVNGEKLVDWVTRLIEGEAVDDVHCRQCRVG